MGKKFNPAPSKYVRNFTVTLQGSVRELDLADFLPTKRSDYCDPQFLKLNFESNFRHIMGALNGFSSEVYGKIIANASSCPSVSYDMLLPFVEILHPRCGRGFLQWVACCVIFAEMLNLHREKHFSNITLAEAF